ncbi:alpha-ketoglutarate decarboxylase [uncultured Winogradskyella sp.]|uniref:alpha-ketoglutarate decarboxylase n=1 Tax=uncultured Winogradskyella sp. TaxID=395353 RepID=UPI00261609ED|nr:alpha-ketoglutarate decarboxylase [uncultured Winogradskyella sp.]
MKKISTYRNRLIKITVLFALVFVDVSMAQTDDLQSNNFWQNVQFGGGIGLNFGNGFFNGSLSPVAIYNFNPYFSAGLGLTGSYSSQRNFFKSTILGGNVLALANPYSQVQLSAEFEQVNVNTNFDSQFVSNADNNFWANALFLGVGYRSGNVIFGIRYDVLYDEDKSIYADPFMPFVRFWF